MQIGDRVAFRTNPTTLLGAVRAIYLDYAWVWSADGDARWSYRVSELVRYVEDIAPGDAVRVCNMIGTFCVVAINDGSAWIQTPSSVNCIVPLNTLTKV